MKKIIYLICLIAVFLGGQSLAAPLQAFSVYFFSGNSILFFIFSKLASVLGYLIQMLIIFRLFSFIKTRSLIIPRIFQGWIYAFTIIALAPALIVIFGYLALGITNTPGLSGIPLVYTYIGVSFFLAMPVLICEFHEFYKCVPGRNT